MKIYKTNSEAYGTKGIDRGLIPIRVSDYESSYVL